MTGGSSCCDGTVPLPAWSSSSFVVRRARWVGGLGALLLLVVAVAGLRLGGGYDGQPTLPGSQASAAADLLEAHQADDAPGGRGRVVLHDPAGLADDEAALSAYADRLAGAAGVETVSDPLADGTVSDDGTTAFLDLGLETGPRDLTQAERSAVRDAAVGLPGDVEVSYADDLGSALESGGGHRLPEIVGLGVALVLLLLVLRSVLGALLPLVTAILGVAAGLGLLSGLATEVDFASSAPVLATMIGLGCGIDYGLFLLTSVRDRLAAGEEVATAVRGGLVSGGHAVVTAALTVAVALLGLFASGIPLVGRLGLAAAITLATAAATAVTVLPAALALLGRRVGVPAAPRGDAVGRWRAHADRVARRPVLTLVGTLLVLAVLTVPLLSMRLGHVDVGADPVGSTTRTAYDRMSSGFPTGAEDPITLVLDIGDADLTDRELGRASRAVVQTIGQAAATPFQRSDDGAIATATVLPADPDVASTERLLRLLEEVTTPQVEDITGLDLGRTGPAVAQDELQGRVAARLPVIVLVIVAGAFTLLTAAFRAPVVALKAAVTNLVSIGASYGVLVAVFQWQWGSSLLGLDQSVPIESYVPMMMFAVVFGLSMDYEVFLLSRVREEWRAGAGTTEAVARGLAATARVISAAAAIMVSVFLAFTLQDDVVVTMLAVGLAVSVALDATLVRLLLVPAAMVLMGDANWWRPRRRVTSRRATQGVAAG